MLRYLIFITEIVLIILLIIFSKNIFLTVIGSSVIIGLSQFAHKFSMLGKFINKFGVLNGN